MGAQVDDLDDLMNELGVDSPGSSAKMVEYLTDCGGVDAVSFEHVSVQPKQCIKAAKEYEKEIKETLDPTKIMVIREGCKVWLYLMEFYYQLNSLSEGDDSAEG